MYDSAFWDAWFRSEYAGIQAAPFALVGAIVVGWLVGWLVTRAWHHREIRAAETQVRIVAAERDLERRQKEGLREAIKNLTDDEAPLLALEIGFGDPDIKNVVDELAYGKTFTSVNSSMPKLYALRRLKDSEIKQIATASYTSAHGISRVERTTPFTRVYGRTRSAEALARIIQDLPGFRQ